MALFKRILAGVVMAIAGAVIAVAIAGIIAVWVYNTPVTTALLDMLGAVDKTLVQIDTAVDDFTARLDNTLQGLDELSAQIKTMGQNVAENTIILDAVEARWGADLAPKVEGLRETAQTARDTVAGIQATIEAVNSIPFVTVPMPDMSGLQQISSRATEVRENAQTLRTELTEKKVETADKLVTRLTAAISRVSEGLQRLQTALITLDERLAQTLTQIRWMEAETPGWVDWFSIISTVLLLWLILSQVSLFVHAYRVMRPAN